MNKVALYFGGEDSLTGHIGVQTADGTRYEEKVVLQVRVTGSKSGGGGGGGFREKFVWVVGGGGGV